MQLDSHQLNALEPADRERYVLLEKLFRSQAWKVVQATVKARAEQAIPRAAFAKSWEENRTAVGYGYAYDEMSHFEESTEQEYEAKAAAVLGKAPIDDSALLDELE